MGHRLRNENIRGYLVHYTSVVTAAGEHVPVYAHNHTVLSTANWISIPALVPRTHQIKSGPIPGHSILDTIPLNFLSSQGHSQFCGARLFFIFFLPVFFAYDAGMRIRLWLKCPIINYRLQYPRRLFTHIRPLALTLRQASWSPSAHLAYTVVMASAWYAALTGCHHTCFKFISLKVVSRETCQPLDRRMTSVRLWLLDGW